MKEVMYNSETFELIQGYKDEEGTLHTEVEIREMNGTDEEAISKNDIKSNGGKVARTLLERCILRIGTIYKDEVKSNKWREIVQSLSVGDQDYVLLKIRQASLGDEIETQYECPDPNCKEKIITTVTVDELPILPFNGQHTFEFELPKGYKDKDGKVLKKGKMRFPNGLDREALDTVVRKNSGLANTLMLSRCIIDLEGIKVHDDIVRNLSLRDRNYLLDVLNENRFGVDLTVEVECPTCGETFKASLNATNFL